MLYVTIVLIFVFFAGLAMTINEGLWNNTVLLLCIILGGLFAILGGIPLGLFIVEQADLAEENVWQCVFAGVWGVFIVSLTIMRVLVEKSSRTRVKFVPPLERAAGPLMGLFVAIMFTSFAAYTMERIPFNAGQWPLADAAGWQKTVFTYARAPFHNVVTRFADSEGIRSEFFPKSR